MAPTPLQAYHVVDRYELCPLNISIPLATQYLQTLKMFTAMPIKINQKETIHFLKNPLTDTRFVFALLFFFNGFYPYLVFHIPITKRNCQLNRKLEQPSTHAPF